MAKQCLVLLNPDIVTPRVDGNSTCIDFLGTTGLTNPNSTRISEADIKTMKNYARFKVQNNAAIAEMIEVLPIVAALTALMKRTFKRR